MHLHIEWSTPDNADRKFDYSWEPLTQVIRDQPQAVREYFTGLNISVEKVMADEAKRNGPPTQTNNRNGQPSRQQSGH
jgi:hypothetical protein